VSITTDIIPTPVEVRRILPTDSHDAIANKLMALDRFTEWLKETRSQVEQEAQDWINENGSVTVGTTRYYVGVTKKPPKCVNVPAAVEAILKAVGGDFDRFTEHLSAGAIKYGAAKQTLPAEAYGLLFVREEVTELQTENAGKPAAKLQKVDTRYLAV
jgi:hypothetical protein